MEQLIKYHNICLPQEIAVSPLTRILAKTNFTSSQLLHSLAALIAKSKVKCRKNQTEVS